MDYQLGNEISRFQKLRISLLGCDCSRSRLQVPAVPGVAGAARAQGGQVGRLRGGHSPRH